MAAYPFGHINESISSLVAVCTGACPKEKLVIIKQTEESSSLIEKVFDYSKGIRALVLFYVMMLG